MASIRHPPVPVNILIVEADPLNRRFLADALQANGYSTLTAKGWREASSIASNEACGLVLCEPTPGRARQPDDTEREVFLKGVAGVPVIAITASAIPDNDREFAAYLSKPARLESLLKAVESEIGLGRHLREQRRAEDK